MNLRPSGYEPDELPTAPSRDINFLSVIFIIQLVYVNVKGIHKNYFNFLKIQKCNLKNIEIVIDYKYRNKIGGHINGFNYIQSSFKLLK